MPAVVAAFKNLIRKHHHPQQRHPSPDEQQDAIQTATSAQADHPAPSPTPAPEIAQAHDMTASEDHKPKVKMPTYKGLENFKLLEKMGESVVRKLELNASQAGEKHLSPHFKKQPRATEPIRADTFVEVQIMRGINHPSIVKLLSFSESPEHYFLVLELMDGGELFHQIVKLTYFSENLSRHVILQVAQAIRYLHEERGVVHRDIKPENLLFERIPIIPSKNPVHRPYDEEKEDEGEYVPGVGGGGIGRIKIADFGLSKVVWNEETMTPCGTVGYTAPEIVKDERYSKSVDMWALGCVLYTLLCGFPPFYDESINVLTEKVARGYYTFLSPWWDDISYSAKDLIQHLLCVDPAQRYTIDEFLAHPWCTAASSPPPPPTPAAYPREPLDSPLLAAARGLVDARSPGLASLKEAFDVTYAVHRMEEGRCSTATTAGAKVVAAPRTTRGSVNPDGNMGVGRAQKEFELDIDNATLLGRRHKKNAGVAVSTTNFSPLAQSAISINPLPPGSPMRV
ncbi:kinase-like domain-containing protein, partial [Pisolithus orientalis]|uniref:kinase-like domain-containing protein n=1 Tax=Pisolithus orientalis TaxID=936130 RepID=UPI0022246F27